MEHMDAVGGEILCNETSIVFDNIDYRQDLQTTATTTATVNCLARWQDRFQKTLACLAIPIKAMDHLPFTENGGSFPL